MSLADEAIARLTKARAALPSATAVCAEYLANAHEEKGAALTVLGKYPEALVELERSMKLSPPPLRVLFRRVMVLSRQADHAAMAAEAPRMAGVRGAANDPILPWYLGQLYGAASGHVRRDVKLPEPERVRLAEEYAGTATGRLRQAFAAGFFNTPERLADLRELNSIQPLHGRADFQKLLQEAEAAQKGKAAPKAPTGP